MVQPKLSITCTVTLSPFWIIGGLAAKSLEAPDLKFNVLELPEEIVVVPIINV